MNTLDFGHIMETDECWFEEYDLTCPYCHGQSEVNVYKCTCECGKSWEVKSYEEPMDDVCECGSYSIDYENIETVTCEECTNGSFEVMWNTAFEVHVDSDSFKEDHLKAWDNGFCLIPHNADHYLLMGACGLDMTWCIHYTRWIIQGFLDDEDFDSLLSSGGHVFLPKQPRTELAKYMQTHIQTPESYLTEYGYKMEKLTRILSETE